MKNIIKKTPSSIYSQPTKNKTQGSDSNDIFVSTNKAIIIIKSQNGQVSKAAKNPNKSTTHEETKIATTTNLLVKISSKILISNNRVTFHTKSSNL